MRQRTPPSEIILFWSHVTSVFQGLSLSRSMGAGRREPWERGWSKNPLLTQTLPIMQLRISTPTTPLKAALMLHHLTILPNPVDKNGLGKSTKESWKLSINCFPLLLKAPTHLWCVNNPTKRLNLNVNKLANVRCDIVHRERLTKMKLPASSEV